MTVERIRSLLKTYRFWVILFGAIIIAITFAVKDAWRENLKDDSDSTNSAINVLLIRQDNEQLSAGLNAIQAEIVRLESETNSPKLIGRKHEGASLPPNDVPDLGAAVMPIYRNLENLQEFDAAHPDKSVELTLEQFSKRLAELELLRAKYEEANKHGSEASANIPLFLTVRLEISQLSADIGAYEIKIVANSIATKEQNRKRYERATYFGYALFVLGLIVTVLPKLLGVDSEVTEAPGND